MDQSNTFPRRSGTLSWQQRPRKNLSDLPQASSATLNSPTNTPLQSAASATTEPSGSSQEPSKNHIIQSLGSKDPSWFRQTEDRAGASAAFRKSRDANSTENSSWSAATRLPGMTGGTKGHDSAKATVSRDGSFESPAGSISGLSASTTRSPLPSLDSQKLGQPSSETSSFAESVGPTSAGRNLAMSPSQGRLSPERMERPASPTKGLGGFVQSAMMKRSESVSKRWSATATPGLSRGNSILSTAAPRFPAGDPKPLSGPRNSASRESSPVASPRPISSHGTERIDSKKENVQPQKQASAPDVDTIDNTVSMGPRNSRASPAKSPPSPEPEDPVRSPPISPGKRWSPSKSSWLEHAISRPESPQVLSPALAQPPAWMART